MYWQETGLDWIPPSPNLPTPFSAMVYPGQVIFEGTNVSEARGTTLPFEQFGAPYIDALFMEKRLQSIPGIHLRPVCFEPTSGKWANKTCQGFHIHITDKNQYTPYLASLIFFQEILRAHPQDFEFKQPPYEYEYNRLPMDLILGSKSLRESVSNMVAPKILEEQWQEELNHFIKTSASFYLYE